MTKKLFFGLTAFSLLSILGVSNVSAHVVVGPSEVKTATSQDFNIRVPNEKDVPTTQVRLTMPEGVENVTPYVKTGWKIETKKSGNGEDALVTEITWSGGQIGEGLADNFVFRARTSSQTGELVWKAYQTYADGSVVAWDQAPSDREEEESETNGPYSKTTVVAELSSDNASTTSSSDKTTTYIAYGALLVAVVSLAMNLRGKSAK